MHLQEVSNNLHCQQKIADSWTSDGTLTKMRKLLRNVLIEQRLEPLVVHTFFRTSSSTGRRI
jgi:hypothetical protein